MNLNRLASAFSRLQAKDLTISPHLCVRLRSPKASCHACQSACPHGVIDWQDGLSVDLDLCDGCGLCAAACMNGVISLPSLDRISTERQVAGDRDGNENAILYVACRKADAAAAGRAMRLPCLGAIEPSLISTSARSGFNEIVLVDAGCSGCPSSSENDITAQLSRRYGLRISESLPADAGEILDSSEGLSRRHFFGNLGEIAGDRISDGIALEDTEVAGAPASPVAQVTKEAILRKAVPDKRERMLRDLLWLHGAGRIDRFLALLGRLGPDFHNLTVDEESCDLCDQCSLICPTGALEKSPEGRLELFIPFCTGCRLCSDVCPHAAILVGPAQMISGAIARSQILVSKQMASCSSCGHSFVPPESASRLCPRCRVSSHIDDGFHELLDL